MLRTRVKAGPVAGLVMSLLFALALTGVAVAHRWVVAWTPAVGQPTSVVLRVPYGPHVVRDRLTGRADLRYEHARIVIPRGTVLRTGSDTDQTALGFELAHRPPKRARVVAVFAIFLTLAMGLTAYLRRFGHQRLRLLRVQAGLLVAMALMALISQALLLFTAVPEFRIPLAAVPLWVATSFDRRTAFVISVVMAFVVASFLEFDLILLSVLLARGLAATLFFRHRRHSRHMALAGLLAGLSAVALYVAILVTFEGRFDWLGDLGQGTGSQLAACLGGGILSGLLAVVVRAPAARLLGMVTREKLVDLSDLEQQLLVRLAREAPGTYEHSRAMANLAEQAASAIGADALITRVGAYYHDLGKTTQPKYFVENLGPDERSPHDELDPDVSADAIMAHVVTGAKILRDGGVPEPVVEFAYTHHGTQMVEYFWNKCLQGGNPKELDASAFRYPGMRPQTRETAIVMLVDSIEAASRTIDPPERDQFENMIQRIVFTKLKDGQLDESGLEMSDLSVIINRMADTLVNMHHHRIKYQWQAQRAQEFGVPSEAVSAPFASRIPLPSEPAPPRPTAPAPPLPRPAGRRPSSPEIEVATVTLGPPPAESVAPPVTSRSARPALPPVGPVAGPSAPPPPTPLAGGVRRSPQVEETPKSGVGAAVRGTAGALPGRK